MDKMISEQKGVKFNESTVLNYFTQVSFFYQLKVLRKWLKIRKVLGLV